MTMLCTVYYWEIIKKQFWSRCICADRQTFSPTESVVHTPGCCFHYVLWRKYLFFLFYGSVISVCAHSGSVRRHILGLIIDHFSLNFVFKWYWSLIVMTNILISSKPISVSISCLKYRFDCVFPVNISAPDTLIKTSIFLKNSYSYKVNNKITY